MVSVIQYWLHFYKIVISMAKISTNGDFVEDCFHIRNEFGMKVDNETFIKNLKSEILSSLTGVLKNVS